MFLRCLILILCVFTISKPLSAAQTIPKKMTKAPFAIINNPGYNPGMFSVVLSVIGALDQYDIGKYSGIRVQLQKGVYYDPQVGPNWWNYFFVPIELGSDQLVSKRIFSDDDLTKLGHYALKRLSKTRGAELFKKYVHLKPEIEDKISSYVQGNFGNDYIIGIHYRGTDKLKREAKRVAYDRVANAINQAIAAIPASQISSYKIFVATDEQQFLDYLKQHFAGHIICIEAIRSSQGRPVHFNYYSSNYKRGEDALIDCVLLSRCSTLIRTESNLSYCSELFNADLPVVVLR